MQKPQLHYYDLDDNVVAFSSTRHGGYSTGSTVSSTSMSIVATMPLP